jgi:hypothetical protein
VQVEEDALHVREDRLEARPEERYQEGDDEREAGVAGYGPAMLLRREQLFPPTSCLIWSIL